MRRGSRSPPVGVSQNRLQATGRCRPRARRAGPGRGELRRSQVAPGRGRQALPGARRHPICKPLCRCSPGRGTRWTACSRFRGRRRWATAGRKRSRVHGWAVVTLCFSRSPRARALCGGRRAGSPGTSGRRRSASTGRTAGARSWAAGRAWESSAAHLVVQRWIDDALARAAQRHDVHVLAGRRSRLPGRARGELGGVPAGRHGAGDQAETKGALRKLEAGLQALDVNTV